MPLHAIAYVSEGLRERIDGRLDEIVNDAARFNRIAGVTGVLLHDGSRFLQYFEGPVDGMDLVYERILQARSHQRVIELARDTVSQRLFPYWAMRWLAVDADRIRQLSQGDWLGFSRELANGRSAPSAIDLLDDVVRPALGVD